MGQKHNFIKNISIIIAKYSYPFFYAVYVVGFALSLFQGRKTVFEYLFIPFTVYLINNTLRSSLKRKRPFNELDITPLLQHKSSPSCPSNHTACAMVIALSFLNVISFYNILWLNVIGVLILISGIFTGLSRVVCGIHYPKDILLGYIIGIFGFIIEISLINTI